MGDTKEGWPGETDTFPGESRLVTSSTDTSLWKMWGEMLNNTSLHGVSKISRGKTICHGVFWAVMTSVMLALLITVFVLYSLDYFLYETLIKRNFKAAAELEFPSVTVCNLSPINISSINQSDALNWYFLATHVFGRFDLSEQFNTSDPRFSVLHEKRNDSWLRHTAFNKSCVYYIEFGGVRMSTQSYIKYRATDAGMCFSFNGPSQTPPLVSKMTGSRRGLTMFVYIDQDNYVFPENMGAGLKYTFLKKPYKAFGDKYCIDNNDPAFQNPLKYYNNYSLFACLRECRARYIFKVCTCRHINDFGEEEICTFAQEYNCVKDAKDQFDGDFSLQQACECPQMCKLVTFEKQLSFARLPSEKYQRYFESVKINDIHKNHIELRFFYETFVVESVEQVSKIELSSVLGNVGGYLGIFLGASILTLTEWIEFFALALYVLIKRMLRWTKCNVISSERADKN
uniref:Amiloride-sensitive cation channel 2, neuronal n=1 Tax=Magallana gigas TaxID=29159 RepID=K1S523_MAGGI